MLKLVLYLSVSLTFFFFANSVRFYKEPKGIPLDKDYEKFLEEFREHKEKDLRYQNATFVALSQKNFLRMKNEIDAHHASFELGMTTYDRKLQPWSDLSKEEKMRTKCGTKLPRRPRALTNAAYLRLMRIWPSVPNGTQVNRCQFPNRIPDQGTCGCCWAFACTQVLEHQMMVHKNRRLHLSVQQLVDCDASNDACEGGWPTNAYRYIEVFGLTNGNEYIYLEKQQNLCKRAFHRRLLRPRFVENQIEVELKGDEELMKRLIMRVGSVVVAMHSDEEFLSITKGLYQNKNCPKNDPNHAMVLCGFGVDENGEFWLVRNSWGSSWGEYGYVKMKMGNTCGVAGFAMWPTIIGERSKLNPFILNLENRWFQKSYDSEHLRA